MAWWMRSWYRIYGHTITPITTLARVEIEGEREGEREGGRAGGREGGRERGREGGREGRREGGREGEGRYIYIIHTCGILYIEQYDSGNIFANHSQDDPRNCQRHGELNDTRPQLLTLQLQGLTHH